MVTYAFIRSLYLTYLLHFTAPSPLATPRRFEDSKSDGNLSVRHVEWLAFDAPCLVLRLAQLGRSTKRAAPLSQCRCVWIGALSPGLAWSVPTVGKEALLGIAKTRVMTHSLRTLTQRRARQCFGHVRKEQAM